MTKHAYEKHSLCTLSRRFKGLLARNTIVAWIESGRLRPELVDQTAAPYLFQRDDLDAMTKKLVASHDARVAKMEKDPIKFREVRDRARTTALMTLTKNIMAEASGRRDLVRAERNLALDDIDAIGGTKLTDDSPKRRIVSCDLTGKPWKGAKK